MKGFAKGILAIILVSLLLQPLIEVINVMREKIIISSALWNACNASSKTSMIYENQRDRDVVIDEILYKQYFTDAFENAMDVDLVSTTDNTLIFSPNNNSFNDFIVYIYFDTNTELGLSITEVTAKAESLYKYKTKYLQTANDFSNIEFSMVCERSILLKIRN